MYDKNEFAGIPEQQYKTIVEGLIEDLNFCLGDEHQRREELLSELKATDKLYLEGQGEILAHVLFSRHAKCSSWGQKRFGLNFNSAIDSNVEKNLATTNQYTRNILFYPDKKSIILVSPMVRALQTASLLIPQNHNAVVIVDPALAENSNAPSGLDYRSMKDVKEAEQKISFLDSPAKYALIKFSQLPYGEKEFKILNTKREHAATILENANIYGAVGIRDNMGKVKQEIDFKKNKIAEIEKILCQAHENDVWLIGHGKNFKAFFSHLFGDKSTFAYTGTKCVYKVREGDSKFIFFSPPYVLAFNQTTGKIEGKYTGIINRSQPKECRQEENLKGSPQKFINKKEKNFSPITMIQGLNIESIIITNNSQERIANENYTNLFSNSSPAERTANKPSKKPLTQFSTPSR